MTNDSRKTTYGWAAPQVDDDATVVQHNPPQPVHADATSYEWQQYLAAKAAWDEQQRVWQQQAYVQQQQAAAQQQQYAQQQAYVQQSPYVQQPAYAQQPDYAQQAYPQPQAYPQQAQPLQPPPAVWHQQAMQQAVEMHAPVADSQRPPSQPPPSAASTDPETLRTKADATHGVSDRVRFIRLTYLHLLLAILVFAGLEYLLNTNPFLVENVSAPLTSFALRGRNWGIVLVAFMAASWIADQWASRAGSKPIQYAGLLFYVLAEALIFVPLLAIVAWRTQEILARGGAEPHILRDAAFTTIGVFVALTLSVFVSRKDFSFLRSGLMMASGAALALIFLAIGFGFELGLAFSVAMVLLAAGYMLYQTSQVLAHYDPGSHVAAALALFSSVALMFWYIIRIFLKMRE
jgi:FtsH-binding integral membrane protein